MGGLYKFFLILIFYFPLVAMKPAGQTLLPRAAEMDIDDLLNPETFTLVPTFHPKQSSGQTIRQGNSIAVHSHFARLYQEQQARSLVQQKFDLQVQEAQQNKDEVVKKSYQCGIDGCLHTETDPNCLKAHRWSKHLTQHRYKCSACAQTYLEISKINAHFKKSHRGKKPKRLDIPLSESNSRLLYALPVVPTMEVPDKNKFECLLCHTVCKEDNKLNHYTQRHNGKIPFLLSDHMGQTIFMAHLKDKPKPPISTADNSADTSLKSNLKVKAAVDDDMWDFFVPGDFSLGDDFDQAI